MDTQSFIDIAIRLLALYGLACLINVTVTATRRRWTRFYNQLYTRGYNDHADGLHNWYKN